MDKDRDVVLEKGGENPRCVNAAEKVWRKNMGHKFICDETTVVHTPGGDIQGYFYNDVYTFKGIQYAVAKRFQAPEPAEVWEGVKDATSFGYVCPLLHVDKPNGELNVPHRYWVENEDCLNLNVWTPQLDDRKRPVIVWLHGGGFEAGSSIEQVAYDGDVMSYQGDVVVVSINHRLNILGYFDLSEYGEKYSASANAGNADMIAALKWIRDNIAAFGGNPDNITLAGQSGGGEKITALLQNPAADGLFHRGIIMSGVVNSQMMGANHGSSRPLVSAMLSELGENEVEALETIPYCRLAEAYMKVSPQLKAKGEYTGCCPKVGADFVGHPNDVGFRPETVHIPLIVGTVFGEFSFWKLSYDKRTLSKEQGETFLREKVGADMAEKLLPLFREAYPDRNPVDLCCYDTVFRCPSVSYISKRAKMGGKVYAYLFDMDFQLEGGKPAWHCSDIPFFFHNTHLTPYANIEGVTEKLQQQIFESVIAFAKSGDPNHDGIPQWKSSSEDEENTMLFGENTKSVVNHDKKLLQEFIPAAMKIMMEMMSTANIQH